VSISSRLDLERHGASPVWRSCEQIHARDVTVRDADVNLAYRETISYIVLSRISDKLGPSLCHDDLHQDS